MVVPEATLHMNGYGGTPGYSEDPMALRAAPIDECGTYSWGIPASTTVVCPSFSVSTG
jgi:hypothetical protein